MGMYTEFIFGCSLKLTTPKIMIDAMDYLINIDKKPKFINPKTFEEKQYNEAFIERSYSDEEILSFIKEQCLISLFNGGSSYFPYAWSKGSFYYKKNVFSGDYYRISTRANLKNSSTIEDFLEYIKPHILEGSGPSNVYAYVQYEESEFPTIYSLEYGKTDVLDSDVLRKYEIKQNKNWEHFFKLYNLISPDFQVTEKMLKDKGIDVRDKEASFLGTLDITIDHICELYKKSQKCFIK